MRLLFGGHPPEEGDEVWNPFLARWRQRQTALWRQRWRPGTLTDRPIRRGWSTQVPDMISGLSIEPGKEAAAQRPSGNHREKLLC